MSADPYPRHGKQVIDPERELVVEQRNKRSREERRGGRLVDLRKFDPRSDNGQGIIYISEGTGHEHSFNFISIRSRMDSGFLSHWKFPGEAVSRTFRMGYKRTSLSRVGRTIGLEIRLGFESRENRIRNREMLAACRCHRCSRCAVSRARPFQSVTSLRGYPHCYVSIFT